ncbi:MAG: YitT family protein [Firmicutes bacterium]|nr:YitT family protein [Bacillota bacterium]
MNKQKVLEIGMIILGNFLVAVSVAFFILPNDILSGGVAGVAVALKPVLAFDSILLINILTITLFVLGWILLGKKFAYRTLLSTICYTVFVNGLNIVVGRLPASTFTMDAYIASIYSGILSGIGLGLAFKAHASTGGMDIPALILHKYAHLKESDAVMLIDGLTIFLGFSTYGLNAALIGILSVFSSGYAINRTVMLGSQTSKNVMIVSSKEEEIRKYILEEVERGATILEGYGAYTMDRHPVLMCAISNKEYPHLEKDIKQIDEKVFMIVTDAYSVHGEGFTNVSKVA